MNIHIWRYSENQRNYPGYHFSADAEGCKALLNGFESPCRMEFKLLPVTKEVLSVPNNKDGSAPFITWKKFEIVVLQDGPKDEFAFTELNEILKLRCDRTHLSRMAQGVRDIQRGHGDYSIGTRPDQGLWFWWYPVNAH